MKGELLGFTIGDIHSSEFNMVRSNNGLASLDFFGKFQDSTVKLENSDITVFYNSFFQSKSFQLNAAFTNLTEDKLSLLKKTWNSNELYKLIFDENPHKYYMVKIDKLTSMKHLAFEKGNLRYYNGEITFTFVGYFPYAISRFESIQSGHLELASEPDLLGYWEELEDLPVNRPEFTFNSSKTQATLQLYNYGDLPAIFELWSNIIIPEQQDAEGSGILGLPFITEEKRIKFNLTITCKTENAEEEQKMELKGLLKDIQSSDKRICIDFFRCVIEGSTWTDKTKTLYNGTMLGDFIIIPPKENIELNITLSEASAYDNESDTIDSQTTINLDHLALDYKILYIYRE